MTPSTIRVLRLLGVVVAGAAAGVAALALTSPTTGTVSVGTVEVEVRPGGPGSTVLALPPLGRIVGDTHDAPFTVSANVTSLDVERVQALVTRADPAARLRQQAASGFEAQLRRLLLRTLALSAVVGAVTAALLPGRRWSSLPLGAVAAVVAVAACLGLVWRGYDVSAFEREPRFEGALERAPALLETVQRHVEDFDAVRNRVAVLGGRIAELYTAVAADDPRGSSDTLILHVSDVHSNPLAIDLVGRLMESFDIEAVLDTGDLTSFGARAEARIGDLIDDLGVRYLLVPGNHDSPANRLALDARRGVEVLDREVVSVGGTRILGVADPTFTADNELSTSDANERKGRTARSVGRSARLRQPDVLAVHDLRQAEQAVGDVPVVVAGHTHRRSMTRRDGTILLTVGSTGATGLGSFTAQSDLPYEAEILHFRRGQLIALDYISMTGFEGSFTVDHVAFEP